MFYWSPVQSNAALLANNSQHCWMLRVPSVCTPCCMLLRVVGSCCSKFETGQSFERNSVWSVCHISSNIVGATHTYYTEFAKSYGLYPSHDAPQVLTLMGVVAAICTPFSSPEPVVSWPRGLDRYKLSRVALGTRMFAHNCQHGRNNSQHCWFST